jgi:PHD/YefM family antitoxin component YafN of YafNO toxin-antitoxin module
MLGEAFRLIEDAALLPPAEKARMKEAETARIQRSPAASAVPA